VIDQDVPEPPAVAQVKKVRTAGVFAFPLQGKVVHPENYAYKISFFAQFTGKEFYKAYLWRRSSLLQ
jgi:hypothetical protein